MMILLETNDVFFLRYLRLVMDTDRRIGNDMVRFYYV